jgi:predicted small metal-binding protein
MTEPHVLVRCVCGWETSGPESSVVAATQEHGRALHNMAATREQVLAMAVSAGEGAPGEPIPPKAG